MELAGVDGGDGESDGGDGVVGAEVDVGLRVAHRLLRVRRDREPEAAAPALHRLKSRQHREARSGSPASTRSACGAGPRTSRSALSTWRKPFLSSMEMANVTVRDSAVVGGAAGDGVGV